MRKALLSAALVAACFTASAQKLTYIPWTENALMQGTVISDNGKYVGGGDTEGRAFIYDTEKGKIKYFVSDDLASDDSGLANAEVRSITNDGIGVGYIDEIAAKFDFSTGKYEKLLDEPSIANYITNGGKVFGLTYDNTYAQYPMMIVDGKKTELPKSSEAWLGFENAGMGIRGGNSDGSVLVGYGQDNFDTYPMMIWALNDDNTTYSVIPACKKYLDTTMDFSGPQDFDTFEGAAISRNGKYVALNIHGKDDYDHGMVIGRYNVETDTYETITCPESSADVFYYSNAIADDGTIIGYIEDDASGARYAMIVKAGETEAKRMSEVFPTLTDIAKMDANESNTPCSITPDGRYIQGFGYVDMDESNLCWGTYYIDTKTGTDGVDNAASEAKSNKVVASYSIDGKKSRQAVANRLHINKLANGKAVKVAK